MDTLAASQSASAPDNVVALTDTIMREGGSVQTPAAQTEMERKRQIMLRAFELTASQLEHDAMEIEKHAIIDEMPIKKRHEMMRTAEALRITQGWIHGVLLGKSEGPENA